MHSIRTTLLTASTALAAALSLAALTTAGPAIAASHQTAKPKQKPTPTAFALRTSGFSTRVTGGQVPAGSGTTAYQVIGCSNEAGRTKTNDVASTALPSLGTVSAAKTKVWTTKRGDVVSSWSRHTVGKIVLSDSPLGSLTIDAVQTTARAYHDGSGFHTDTDTEVGRLTFTPPVGSPVTLPLPTPGQPVDVPGLGSVTIGHSHVRKNATSAHAYANGLKVDLTASGTVVQVAHAQAEIFQGIKTGVFHGSASAVDGDAGDGTIDLGRNLLSLMPCQGTGGKTTTKTLAGTDLGGQVVLGAAANAQMGKQTSKKSTAWERSSIASLDLGGALKVDGIVAKAKAVREGNHLTTSTIGTTIGTITANGTPQKFPDTGVLEIPGVAKLEPDVVTKIPGGVKVIGLRVTLLDGTGAVIDLATAKIRIERSGV